MTPEQVRAIYEQKSRRLERGGGGGGGGNNNNKNNDDDNNNDNNGPNNPPRSPPYNIKQELFDDPRPAQVDFRCFGYQKHPENYPDDYYRNLYGLLYNRTVDFAEKWFGDIDLADPDYTGSPWQLPFNDQFIEYTRLVAHEDRHNGGWPSFLRNARYRKWLVVGILGQIMEKKIFNELLFGASPFWKAELEREDRRLVDIEGKIKNISQPHFFS